MRHCIATHVLRMNDEYRLDHFHVYMNDHFHRVERFGFGLGPGKQPRTGSENFAAAKFQLRSE